MPEIHAKKLYTGREVLAHATVGFAGKKIRKVAAAKGRSSAETYPVVTPAFIDPHSHIGMHRSGEPAEDGEANEKMDSILALADALDSVQMDDPSFAEAVEMGVLYSCVVPGSGNLIGGVSAVIRNYAENTSSAMIARAGLKAAMGHNPKSAHAWKGSRSCTRMGSMAIMRKKLDEVRQKMAKARKARGRKKSEISFSAEEKVLRDVLARKLRLRVHCHKADDIAALLRLVDEFKLDITVEHAADIHAESILRELEKRKIPVVFGPPDAFPYKVELKHFSWRNVRLFVESKLQVGLMTDHPVTLAKMLLLQTRHFLRSGLSRQQAIELITRANAEILGIQKILGTLEPGKWASMVCWNGDPFDLASYPVAVYAEGEKVYPV